MGKLQVNAINSIARRQFKKFKRVRRLQPIFKQKAPVLGGDGVSFGSVSGDPAA